MAKQKGAQPGVLGIQDVKVKKVVQKETEVEICFEMRKKEQVCPCCGAKTNAVHDYRIQKVKDLSCFGKRVEILFQKRRYRCKACQKRFYEKNTVVGRYQRRTKRLTVYILRQLCDERSFSSVAREVNLSVTTVMRIFDIVSYPKAALPRVLAIDEFKGNAWGQKYHCILTDPEKQVVLDVLPQRHSPYLTHYFQEYPKQERQKVQFFVSDMWKPYTDNAAQWFQQAIPIVDKYHWIRQVIWAFEAVRKEEQAKFSQTHRRYFKRSKSILLKRFKNLTDDQKQQVNVMLYASVNLSRAYYYKEKFLDILAETQPQTAKQRLLSWMQDAAHCELQRFEKCTKTIYNWFSGIANSLQYPFTNGFTEGCNNKIKVLKRNAYGYRNFTRFRNRILHMFSHQQNSLNK